MKKTFKFLIVILLSVTAFSCVKDRGNYDYIDIPEAELNNFTVKLNGVTLPESEYSQKMVVEFGDKLEIINNESASFDAAYKWSIFEKSPAVDEDNNYPQPIKIASTKDLEYSLNHSPSTYMLAYEVTNTENGSSFLVNFELTIGSVLGLFVVHVDNTGAGDYSAIVTPEMYPTLSSSKMGVNNNLYSETNKGEKLDNPTGIFFRTSTRLTTKQSIFIPVKDNIIRVESSTLKLLSSNYSELFYFPPLGSIDMQFLNNGLNSKEQMIVNGELYGIDYSAVGGTDLYGASFGTYGKKYFGGMVNINLSSSSRYHVVYNMTDTKFEAVSQFNAMITLVDGSGPVNFTNTGMELLYMEQGNGYSVNAIMEDSNSNLYFTHFAMTYNSESKTNVGTCLYNHLLTDATVDSKWAMSSRSNIAFYSNGNQLYIYNVTSGESTAVNIGLPGSEIIEHMMILKDATNSEYDNALLIFVTYNGTESTVYQCAFNPLSGSLDLSSQKKFDGFDRIVGLGLKQ